MRACAVCVFGSFLRVRNWNNWMQIDGNDCKRGRKRGRRGGGGGCKLKCSECSSTMSSCRLDFQLLSKQDFLDIYLLATSILLWPLIVFRQCMCCGLIYENAVCDHCRRRCVSLERVHSRIVHCSIFYLMCAVNSWKMLQIPLIAPSLSRQSRGIWKGSRFRLSLSRQTNDVFFAAPPP